MTKVKKRTMLAMIFIIALFAVFLTIGTALPKKTLAATEAEAYSVTDQTGLGLNINVVKAEQVNDFTTGNTVLDLEKISEIEASRVTLNQSESYTHTTADINDLLLDYNLKFNFGSESKIFLCSLKKDLEVNGGLSYSQYRYKFFNILEHKVMRYRLFFNDYLNKNIYTGYFNENFIADLASLSQSGNYSAFFDKYGTHIVGEALYGGKLNATYSVVSNKLVLNNDVSTIMGNNVQFGNLSNNTKNGIVTSLNAYHSMQHNVNDLNIGFYVKSVGGNTFASGVIDNFNTGYSSWANSFNNDLTNSVIMDYTSTGLVPLWDILPAPYDTTLADSMESAFSQYYDNFEESIIDEFKNENTTDFAGGSGTQEDPFLISNETQLKKIDTVSMRCHYKLKNNISLTMANWIPIGGYYKEKAFNGTFDGNGKTIENLKRSSDIAEINHRFYFGLFSYIGEEGVVKNLILSKVNIDMDGPEVNDGSAKIFIGAIAGTAYGIIENVTVYGTCSYDVCTNGTVFVGGIVGVAYQAEIIGCTNEADIVSGRYAGVAGGIAGYSNKSTFNRCKNAGDVLSKYTKWGGHASSGKIAGAQYANSGSTYINCIYGGTVSCKNYGFGPSKNEKTGNNYARTFDEDYN